MDTPIRTYGTHWYELRKTHLGASEIPALCGLDPFKKAWSVFESKHSNQVLQPDAGINTRLWWGHAEEKYIIKAAIHELFDYEKRPWVRDGWSWCGRGVMVSPDAVYTADPVQVEDIPGSDHKVIEAKTVGENVKSTWRKGPPKHVLLQVHTQMTALGSESAHIAARLAGAPVKLWKVERDPLISAAIIEIVSLFWQYETMPDDWDITMTDLLTEVGFLKPVEEMVTREIDLDQAGIILEWECARAEANRAAAHAKELTQQIEDLVGDADGLSLGGSTLVLANTVIREGLDTTSLLIDYPQFGDLYKKITEYRTFRSTESRK